MAVTGNDAVTLEQLKMLRKSSEGGVQFVELFHGNSSSVTLPQPFDTYKVLFVVARNNDDTGSGVCVPPDNKAQFYDGERNQRVSFSGNNVTGVTPGTNDKYWIAG